MDVNLYDTRGRTIVCALWIWMNSHDMQGEVTEPRVLEVCGKNGFNFEEVMSALELLGATEHPNNDDVMTPSESKTWEIPAEPFIVRYFKKK